VLETLTPLVQHCRRIRTDSGGPGLHRGGLGQVVEMATRGHRAWTVNANIDRVLNPAPGAVGGSPGRTGDFVEVTTGRRLPRKQLVRMTAGDAVRLSFPGGGGYGDPRARPVERVLADVVNGYVSTECAREHYGVVVECIGPPDALVRPPESYRLDEAATEALRAES
jgi:N-methylhydantoinase B